MKTWLARLGALGAAVLAAAGLWSAAATDPPRTLAEQSRAVAQTLRCPTCVGEDAADSAAPVAEAMRLVIADQLEQGRSPEQIRTWFAQRYGNEVLLDPARTGTGWLMWGIPVALVGTAAMVLLRRGSAGQRWWALGAAVVAAAGIALAWEVTAPEGRPPQLVQAAPLNTTSVLEQAVAARPGDADLQVALGRALETDGRHTEAAEHYGAAVRLRPFDADTAYLHAAALLRNGQPQEAERVLDRTLASQPEHTPSLLLQGTMLLRTGEEHGAQLLERFLELDPEHVAAPEVRELLATPPGEEP